jgi:lysozyme
MNAIDIVINEIIKNPAGCGEGCKLIAYWDKMGKCWTIGYGCTGPGIVEGVVWSQQYAEAMLRQRVTSANSAALHASPILATASPSREAAITDLIYNLGLGGYVGHSLKPLIDAGNWEAAAQGIKLFCHAGGVVLPGLVKRRKVESDLLLVV